MTFVLRDVAVQEEAFESCFETVARKVAQRRAGYDLGHAETITGPRSRRVGTLGIASRS